jgi:hypothetical protein
LNFTFHLAVIDPNYLGRRIRDRQYRAQCGCLNVLPFCLLAGLHLGQLPPSLGT